MKGVILIVGVIGLFVLFMIITRIMFKKATTHLMKYRVDFSIEITHAFHVVLAALTYTAAIHAETAKDLEGIIDAGKDVPYPYPGHIHDETFVQLLNCLAARMVYSDAQKRPIYNAVIAVTAQVIRITSVMKNDNFVLVRSVDNFVATAKQDLAGSVDHLCSLIENAPTKEQ